MSDSEASGTDGIGQGHPVAGPDAMESSAAAAPGLTGPEASALGPSSMGAASQEAPGVETAVLPEPGLAAPRPTLTVETNGTHARAGAPGTARGQDEPVVGTSPIKVQLPAFDGPLDLLLHLIKRDEINIYDIPISHITGEYLAYIGMLKLLDLDVAGEFLVMAATLMRIKARMLLPPVPGITDEDEEFIDPRDELVQQLLEYRRFKEAAERLHGAEEARRRFYTRGVLPNFEAEELPELMPVGLFALIDVMKDVLARVGDEFFHEVILEEVSLEEKLLLIETELTSRGRVLFRELLERTPRRMHVVVTLMAVLEMARLGKLAVRQEALFGEIWLYQAELAPPLELEVVDETPPAPTGPAYVSRARRARRAAAEAAGAEPGTEAAADLEAVDDADAEEATEIDDAPEAREDGDAAALLEPGDRLVPVGPAAVGGDADLAPHADRASDAALAEVAPEPLSDEQIVSGLETAGELSARPRAAEESDEEV